MCVAAVFGCDSEDVSDLLRRCARRYQHENLNLSRRQARRSSSTWRPVPNRAEHEIDSGGVEPAAGGLGAEALRRLRPRAACSGLRRRRHGLVGLARVDEVHVVR